MDADAAVDPDGDDTERLPRTVCRVPDPERTDDRLVVIDVAVELVGDARADDMIHKQQRDQQAEHDLRHFPFGMTRLRRM